MCTALGDGCSFSMRRPSIVASFARTLPVLRRQWCDRSQVVLGRICDVCCHARAIKARGRPPAGPAPACFRPRTSARWPPGRRGWSRPRSSSRSWSALRPGRMSQCITASCGRARRRRRLASQRSMKTSWSATMAREGLVNASKKRLPRPSRSAAASPTSSASRTRHLLVSPTRPRGLHPGAGAVREHHRRPD